ncbi:MAG TPA: hypothetical protein DD381_06035 [Lentisphaeria bacterium]|nr:MAG: hypothetical protein A2X47_14070 [Lentisphaerae bacterium GWF2_38_69]HBM15885.1 hypothetical protein [Lentisphaeria bacterium]
MQKLSAFLKPQANITDRDAASGLKALIYDGVCFQTMLVLTSGAFLTACIIGVYALATLSKVRETGEKLAKDVCSELMVEISQGIRTMSTVMGLKFLFRVPSHPKKIQIYSPQQMGTMNTSKQLRL